MSLSDEDELMGDPRPASFGEFDVAPFDDEDMEDQVIISIFNHMSRSLRNIPSKKLKVDLEMTSNQSRYNYDSEEGVFTFFFF